MAQTISPGLPWIAAGLALLVGGALAQQTDCLKCHAELAAKPIVHAPVHDGCRACHADIGAAPHGAGAERKRAAAQPAEQCHACHDRKLTEGKYTHAPAESGACLACHDPHSSEHAGLVRRPAAALCLDCHEEVGRRPHLLAGFSGKGHPIGASRAVQDPLRPKRPFYCASCHEPHRSNFARLVRFDAKSMTGFCLRCHNM